MTDKEAPQNGEESKSITTPLLTERLLRVRQLAEHRTDLISPL